jgi:hypothetical protein
MHRVRTPRVLLILVALSAFTLGSCGDRDVEARQSAATEVGGGDGGTDASRPAAQGFTDRFEVTLDQPPFAGSHQASGDMGCMMYNGLWQATWEAQVEDGLSGMLVQMKDVPAAGGSTDKVTLSVMFGDMNDMSGKGGLIDVHGAEFGRDGRGTITREEGGAVLRIEGTAQHGARVTAVLRCASVDLMR